MAYSIRYSVLCRHIWLGLLFRCQTVFAQSWDIGSQSCQPKMGQKMQYFCYYIINLRKKKHFWWYTHLGVRVLFFRWYCRGEWGICHCWHRCALQLYRCRCNCGFVYIRTDVSTYCFPMPMQWCLYRPYVRTLGTNIVYSINSTSMY